MIAPLSSAEPGAGEPRVQVKTWWSDHWVLLGESDVVGATDLENSWTGPDRLAGNQLDAVLREYHRTVV
ncbi:hypothetical protein [Umezawaea sp.]|uniref:hypothetical protein n=1 Tax=Umezawaea sp. TaxID=1955258 RepID=UPI002ED2A87A